MIRVLDLKQILLKKNMTPSQKNQIKNYILISVQRSKAVYIVLLKKQTNIDIDYNDGEED